jgi:hypothetical protein
MNGFYSAQWIKKYKPIEPVKIIDISNITKDQAEILEQHRTLQYMKKYGYQNVSGGKLNYSGKYLKVGDRFFRDKDWKATTTVLAFMAAIIALLISKF